MLSWCQHESSAAGSSIWWDSLLLWLLVAVDAFCDQEMTWPAVDRLLKSPCIELVSIKNNRSRVKQNRASIFTYCILYWQPQSQGLLRFHLTQTTRLNTYSHMHSEQYVAKVNYIQLCCHTFPYQDIYLYNVTIISLSDVRRKSCKVDRVPVQTQKG